MRAAGAATRRGSPSADAGRRAAAADPSLSAASLPIVGGGRRALPAVLGLGGGAACARGENGPPLRPLPGRRGEEEAWRGARRPPSRPRPCRSGSDSSGRSILSLSAHGRLMEGRIHVPLYPARSASCALLLVFATGFGVAPSSSSPHTPGRRLRGGQVCNKSFDFRTHGSCLKSRFAASLLRWPRACSAFEAQSFVLGLCDENTCEDRWPGRKGRLGLPRAGWNKKRR